MAGNLLDHQAGLFNLRRQHHRHALFDDTRFFAGDLGQGVAQQEHVVIRKRGDHRHLRRDHVGGVQAPAQAHLDQRRVTALARKVQESQRGGDLEGGQARDGRDLRLKFLHQRHQLGMRDQLAVDLDALGVIIQVRRGVQAHPVALGLQRAGAQRRDRAFALGAGHVNRTELGLRVA